MSSAPEASSPLIRARMQAQKAKDTKPEVLLRKELHARGMRFRVGAKLPGPGRRTADIAWKGRRIAVFVDGCFWHGCPDHFVPPKSHPDWWQEKIQHNRDRDEDTTHALVNQGWTVIRIWEHVPPGDAADVVQEIVQHGHADASAEGGLIRLVAGCRVLVPPAMPPPLVSMLGGALEPDMPTEESARPTLEGGHGTLHRLADPSPVPADRIGSPPTEDPE